MMEVTKPLATNIKFPIVESKKDPTKMMHALEWFGNQDVRVVQAPKPTVTEPTDAIIRITSTTICGSDLHLYHHEFSGMEKGDVLGHEFMGIVESVGPDVKNLKVGDRVVVSAIIACGKCYYCKNEMYSLCDTTNPSMEMEALYGHRTSGIFGYSHLTGGYEGGQADYARVPIADLNCLKVPNHLRDEQVLFLSDILCTSWHANELAQVSPGQTVAIWGCGPVGLLAIMWAKYRGASRVIAVDGIPHRLDTARSIGAETIDFTQQKVTDTIREMCPGGPDCCIEAVGFRFPKSLANKIQRAVHLQTDSAEILTECIISCKKGGRIGIVGDYYAYANRFPIGAFMEKGLTMAGSQVFIQKYWKKLLEIVEQGKVDPTFIITHTMPLEKASEAYKMFDTKEDNAIKIVLKPSSITSTP